MTINNLIQGYFCLDKQVDVEKVFDIVDTYIHMYKSKHYYDLVKLISKGENTDDWYNKRDEVFVRYCGINYNNILLLKTTRNE